MVQGQTKNLQRKAASRSQQKKAAPKKGQRAIPPKKAAAVKHATLQKSLSAKINNSIERQMATATESTGKLTIVKSSAWAINVEVKAMTLAACVYGTQFAHLEFLAKLTAEKKAEISQWHPRSGWATHDTHADK